MKIVLIGKDGQIGKSLFNILKGRHEILPLGKKECNLLIKDEITSIFNNIKADLVINSAAYTDVDKAESDRKKVFSINSDAVHIISSLTKKHNIPFINYSTDYVFDGESNKKYSEEDIENPINIYGKSKLEGELVLNQLASNWCIARTSTPFGIHNTKKSFPLWIKENLEAKKEISVLTDQFTSPTYVPNLSKMLIEIAIRQIIGIIHVSGATRISRYALAELVADKLHLDKNFLIPTKIDDMNWKAKRPKDSSLDVSLAGEILNEQPQKIEQSIELFINELNSS